MVFYLYPEQHHLLLKNANSLKSLELRQIIFYTTMLFWILFPLMSRDRPENIWYIHLTKKHEKAPRDKRKIKYKGLHTCLSFVPDKFFKGKRYLFELQKSFKLSVNGLPNKFSRAVLSEPIDNFLIGTNLLYNDKWFRKCLLFLGTWITMTTEETSLTWTR